MGLVGTWAYKPQALSPWAILNFEFYIGALFSASDIVVTYGY